MENQINSIYSIEDFLDLYPKLSLKNDFSTPSDYFLKFFNIKNRFKKRKSSIVMDCSQIDKIIRSNNINSRLSTNNINTKEILSLKKLEKNRNISNNILELSNRNKNKNKNYALYKIVENEDIDKYIDLENEDLFLINKGIEFQKRGLKRSNDVKKALESFFMKSELIDKLTKNFYNNMKEIENNENIKDKANLTESNIQYKIKTLISKLAENVIFQKSEKNKFIIKMNDIGKDCFFLISGKLSILKPVEYKHIKITYDDYFKYLLNLLEKNENELLKRVLELNWHFINIYDEDNLLSIVKYYIQNKISVYSVISYNTYEPDKVEDLTLEKIELLLTEFKMKFENFGLSKNKIVSDINYIFADIDNKNKNVQLRINTYFREIFKPSRQSQILLNQYNFLFQKNKNNDINSHNDNNKKCFVTLFKYEIFMILEPGSFFGEMSLENDNRKRNATIRTEEDSILISLSNEQYENLLLDDNKKIKITQVNFLCFNFFFNNISPKLFTKYYYPMFKLVTKKKNEIIYKQESSCTSLFLLKEGTVQIEIYSSIVDIHDLIHFLINALKEDAYLNLKSDYIKQLKEQYLKNNNLITYRNNNIILREKTNKKYKFELSISKGYEVLGIHEFYLKIGHISTCYVNSNNAKFFEINENSLNKIISIEKEILNDYYQLAFNKILGLIKRLFNIENIFIKQTIEKIDTNFFDINDTNYFIDLKEEKKLSLNYQDKYNLNLNDENKEKEKENNNINSNTNNRSEQNELILPKEFENYGHIEKSIIRKNSSWKILEREQKNLKSLLEIKKSENNNSFASSSKLMNLKKIKYNKIEKKEKIENIIKKHKRNIYDLGYNNSIINSNEIKLKNSNSFQSLIPKTIINIGNSYLSLPKLKKKLLSCRNNNDNKRLNLNLSIVKNNYYNKNDALKESQNILMNKKKSKEININYKKENYLPNVKKNDSPGLNSYVSKMKKNINLNKIKNNSESKTNQNHTKDINIYKIEKENNILAKYIKNYYKKRKDKGYSAFINPYNNSIMKIKLLNNNKGEKIK